MYAATWRLYIATAAGLLPISAWEGDIWTTRTTCFAMFSAEIEKLIVVYGRWASRWLYSVLDLFVASPCRGVVQPASAEPLIPLDSTADTGTDKPSASKLHSTAPLASTVTSTQVAPSDRKRV